jgi:hypothetical protein
MTDTALQPANEYFPSSKQLTSGLILKEVSIEWTTAFSSGVTFTLFLIGGT